MLTAIIISVQIIPYRISGILMSGQNFTMKLTDQNITTDSLPLTVRFFPLWQSGLQGYLLHQD